MRLIADNIHILNPVVSKAVDTNDPGPITELARRYAAWGAEAIDVNPGPKSVSRLQTMDFCVRAVRAGTDLPVVLDSNDPELLQQGLQASSGRAIINGFSLEPGKVDTILPLAVEHGLPIVGFLLHPNGHVPKGVDERLQLASELVSVSTQAGLDTSQLIIDPVLAPLGWDDGTKQAQSVLACIGMLPQLLGTNIQTMIGLSNLISGTTHPAAPHLEALYLARLAEAGLSYALLNMHRRQALGCARFCSIIDNGKVFSWAEFAPYFESINQESAGSSSGSQQV